MYNNLQINSIANEEWKPLEFNLRYSYQISNMGRVRIIKKNYCCIKTQRIGNHKHPIVSFRFSKNKVKRYLVHRLVAQSFLNNTQLKRTVNHINGIKHDNRLSNLEWATDKEQAIHRHYVLGKKTTDKATIVSKLTNKKSVAQFDKNNNIIRTFDSLKSASEFMGKTHTNIQRACIGKYKYAYGFIWRYTNIKHTHIYQPSCYSA